VGLKDQVAPHEMTIDDLFKRRKENEIFLSRSTVEREYEKEHKDYQDLRATISAARSDMDKAIEEIRMRESFRSSLVNCSERVNNAGLDIAA
jgi:predicted  nucleic acid-binding Zn-ribbon protein